jgi:peptide/nickel transport system substrate-binding protein
MDRSISKMTTKTGISRRDLMKVAAALSLTLPAASLPWGEAKAAEPKEGGHLRLGLAGGATTDTLDPSTFNDTYMAMVGASVRGNLVEVAPNGSPMPEIAESFEGSDGAKKWVFKLRQGVEFSNGKTLTVDDVIESINHHRGPKSSASGVSALLAPVDQVKADGPTTVVATLKSGNSSFPFVLSDYALTIMPFKDGAPDYNIGAGPYRIVDYQPGVRTTLERYRSSHKKAYFDSAEMLSIADANARQTALVSDEVDLINRPDLKTAQFLGRKPGIRVEDAPSRKYYAFAANGSTEPFSNPDIRLALKFAIDRAAMVKKVLYGHGTEGNDQPITPSYQYYAKNLPPRPYDPDKAKFYLKKAGMDSLRVQLSLADAAFPGAVDAGVLYAAEAAKGGITIETIREADDGYWDKVWMKRPFCATFWGGRPTEDAILTVTWSKSSATNEYFMGNDRLDELLAAARVELDDAKRRAMYQEIQHIASDNFSAIVPMFPSNVQAMSKRVAHPSVLSGTWELDGARCILRWWFA